MIDSKNTTHFHPGFGEPALSPSKPEDSNLANKAGTVALCILAGATVGTIVGGIPGTVVGAAIGCIVGLLYLLVDLVFKKVFSSSHYQTVLSDPPVQDPTHPKIGRYTHAYLLVSNVSDESFEWKKELIRNAESSIELSGNFAGGQPFQEVLALIETRMREKPNLRVHLILSRDLLENPDIEKLRELAKSPNFSYLITDRIYTPLPTPHSEENHVKMLVVDGKYFVVGGSGIHPKLVREEPPESMSKTSSPLIPVAF